MTDGLRLLVAGRAQGFDWRLVSGNGRAVAISAVRFEDHAAAVASFEALCRQADALGVQYVHPLSTVAWTWNVVDGSGAVVASADRAYDRYGTCITACRRFVATVRGLGPAGALRLIGAAR